MGFFESVSPSRRLLALFLILTVAPAAGLAWLGWRLLEQDRALETQRALERQEYAADLVAGALSRQGRTNQAVQSLERVVATISPPPGDSAGQDLLTLAQDYLLVLRGRSAPRVKRAAYADKLARANASEATQSATASIRLWRRIWQMEFARQAKVQQCGESKACIAQATQRARLTAAQIDQRVGREVGLILRGGVLSAGTVGATFNFSLGSGLQPIVRVQPRLLAVEFPRSELVRSEQDGG